ncbi:family 10 glycosylhydrolase [Phormidium sp. LEGE 05292]|uniref:family 10 glycosylhydrolase n=1 Tax=[Phormidium] sp. LEGE 05292 TaxID=767427 RepID=UPI0018803069|nr:family 10 glycosylhydrolase [Phormidium sp. LEGE 05292]MBE9228730.1 family 10 glycosylhydrolase [Phormidium sp. LEGE 05292]
MPAKKENNGCGCASIPFSLIIVLFGFGYWGFTNIDKVDLGKFLLNNQQPTPENLTPAPTKQTPVINSPVGRIIPTPTATNKPQITPLPVTPKQSPSTQTAWEKKEIRGIYLSRYQATNNADEKTIRERVRYDSSQGINTIIHGVWGNGCTMYKSDVMQQTFGYKSCPNQFKEQWLEWLIDEAHKQGMQVHAYFEKGIKIDKNSPIFDEAIAKRWIVPGVDKTYPGIEHYVLDVEIPEVANLFKKILVEFVQKYPTIDAVQWDDYLGYHADLPGKVDRTTHLTTFVRQMRDDMKKANLNVSFDLCHHNPYWGKRYFAADWENWDAVREAYRKVYRVFIQTYNDANFNQELVYAEKYEGVAISDEQLYRLKELMNNPKIKSVLVFPSEGKPEETAALVKKLTVNK